MISYETYYLETYMVKIIVHTYTIFITPKIKYCIYLSLEDTQLK